MAAEGKAIQILIMRELGISGGYRTKCGMYDMCPHSIFLGRGGLDTCVALEQICII